MKRLLGLGLLFTILSGSASALVPPWYDHWLRVQAVLSGDVCVNVEPLKEKESRLYVYQVTVCELEKAKALATFLPSVTEVAGMRVKAEIIFNGTPMMPLIEKITSKTEAETLIRNALKGNGYFLTADAFNFGQGVWVETRKKVLQISNDNIGDRYSMTSFVAADLFRQVFGLSPVFEKSFLRFTTNPTE